MQSYSVNISASLILPLLKVISHISIEYTKMVKQMNADEEFEKLTQEALQQFLERNPEYATILGFHEPYDKLLSNGSIEEVYENLKLMENWLNKIKKGSSSPHMNTVRTRKILNA